MDYIYDEDKKLKADNDNEKAPVAANDNDLDEPRYPPIQETEEPACRELYLSVIIQHILDAKGKRGSKKDQAEALEWLKAEEGEKSGFAEVCMLANLDFEKTRKRCLELLKDERGSVDFRCLKKPALQNRSKSEKRTAYYRRVGRNEIIRRARQKHSLSAKNRLHGNDNFKPSSNDNLINQQEETKNDKQAN